MGSIPSDMFKAMSVETRINIIELLKSEGPLGGNQIAQTMGITPAAVSQHLNILRQAGLVTCERKGYRIPYSINEEGMEKCRHMLNEVCSCGCRGTGKGQEHMLSEASLTSLKEYERELEHELQAVRERIAEITESA